MISVIKGGLLTTVQDEGRWGFQHQGIPVAGPMDLWAHRRANRLVGNEASAAALEITMSGPRLCFEHDAVVAVCGAPFAPRVNGCAVAAERPVTVAAGDELELGWCPAGARATLAVRGGIDVPLLFGSRATHLPSRMGGFGGRALAAGDRLPIGRAAVRGLGDAPAPPPIARRDEPVVRVLPGPAPEAARWFDAVIATEYEVSPESNRMGYRLRGPAVGVPAGDRPSSATPMGSIQLPPSGIPIVLMADRQTTGGYMTVATVIAADLGVLAQRRPGDTVRFERCTRDEAWSALRERMSEVEA